MAGLSARTVRQGRWKGFKRGLKLGRELTSTSVAGYIYAHPYDAAMVSLSVLGGPAGIAASRAGRVALGPLNDLVPQVGTLIRSVL